MIIEANGLKLIIQCLILQTSTELIFNIKIKKQLQQLHDCTYMYSKLCDALIQKNILGA